MPAGGCDSVMRCEIIAVGTELTRGATVNTNAAELSVRLAALGLETVCHTAVPDDPAALGRAVEAAGSRAELLITTGGLGPTYDDLTKSVLAGCFGRKLVFHEEEAAFLRRHYEASGHRLTDNVLQQAWLPEGCEVFHNEWGTAPGCAFTADGLTVIMLPGPPYECLPMFDHCAAPWLASRAEQTVVSHSVHIFGLGESELEARYRPVLEKSENPVIATYAKRGEVQVQVTARARTRPEAEALCFPFIEKITADLGPLVYGVDAGSLEALVLALLRDRALSFASAESLTGGLIGARMTALPGASEVFRGGAVTYCDEMKAALLGVDETLLREKGAVSREVAAAMARGARERTGADFGVSATGLAGPDGDGRNPVGTVFIGLAAPDGVWVRHLRLGARRGRTAVRFLSASHAFDLLRRYLTGLALGENTTPAV